MADRTTNDLDAIERLPFSALSGPEAGEVIRDGLIAEIRWLRADLAALASLARDLDHSLGGDEHEILSARDALRTFLEVQRRG